MAQGYAPRPHQHFDEPEDEIGHMLMAIGRSLAVGLHDLDPFNALTAETENDAWYELSQALSSMHLDAPHTRHRPACDPTLK